VNLGGLLLKNASSPSLASCVLNSIEVTSHSQEFLSPNALLTVLFNILFTFSTDIHAPIIFLAKFLASIINLSFLLLYLLSLTPLIHLPLSFCLSNKNSFVLFGPIYNRSFLNPPPGINPSFISGIQILPLYSLL